MIPLVPLMAPQTLRYVSMWYMHASASILKISRASQSLFVTPRVSGGCAPQSRSYTLLDTLSLTEPAPIERDEAILVMHLAVDDDQHITILLQVGLQPVLHQVRVHPSLGLKLWPG